MRKLWLVMLFGVIGAGGAELAARHFRLAPPNLISVAPTAVPVVVGTVLQHDVPIYLRGVGTVIAYNNVIVRSQITGQLVKIAFTQGQTVKKGDLLAEIDSRPYRAQLDEAIANRDRDQAQVVNAQANLNRYQPLAKNGWASSQLVDTTKAQLAQLQAMVKSDEGVIEQAKANLSYTQLTSPIDGVTGIRQIDIGNIIHPTDANGLVDVTQIEPISLLFSLPQTDFVKVNRQMGKGTLKVLAYSQDNTTQLDEGTLDLVDNQIVQTTGTIRLRASLPNAKHMLWPGELINARLLLESRHNGLTIPAAAIQQRPQGPFVWVIRPDETATTRPVSVTDVGGGDALIDFGLQANETVVVDGQYRLQPGTRVQKLQGDAAKQADLQNSVEQEIP